MQTCDEPGLPAQRMACSGSATFAQISLCSIPLHARVARRDLFVTWLQNCRHPRQRTRSRMGAASSAHLLAAGVQGGVRGRLPHQRADGFRSLGDAEHHQRLPRLRVAEVAAREGDQRPQLPPPTL